MDKSDDVIAVLSLPRSSTLASATLWVLPAVGLGGVAAIVFGQLQFVPSGTSNRLVDYSVAILMIPFVLGAVAFAIRAVGLACMAIWPGSVGVYAGREVLTIRLGPFGTRRYDVQRLEVRYPYELPVDDGDNQFEALLPKEQQWAELVPRMTHPDASEQIDRTIRRMAGMADKEIARVLRPAMDFYRAAGRGGEGAHREADESGPSGARVDGA